MTTDVEWYEKISRSAWLLLPGMTVERIWPDYLHVVDLALAPDAAASAARRLMACVLMYGTPEPHNIIWPWIPAAGSAGTDF